MTFTTAVVGVQGGGCREPGKFFKMFQSYRPEHCWQDEQGRVKAQLLCLRCEQKIRYGEWQCVTLKEKRETGDEHTTMSLIRKEQKDRAKPEWGHRGVGPDASESDHEHVEERTGIHGVTNRLST